METFLRGRIESLLLVATWVEDLRKDLDLRAASQVWGDTPAWYLWLGSFAGAFGLELVEASIPPELPQAVRGLFSIKYYPHPDEPAWALHAPAERELAGGPLFDDSHTPTFEGRPEIPGHFFTVGVLELTCQAEEPWALFSLAAPQTCRLLDPNLQTDPLRAAPGWGPAHALFRALVGLHAFQAGCAPVRSQLTSEPGWELIADDSQPLSARPCAQTSLYTLWLLFAPQLAAAPAPLLDLLDQELLPPERQGLHNQTHACHHLHDPGPELLGSPALHPGWWSLAHSPYTSHLASSCGCEH